MAVKTITIDMKAYDTLNRVVVSRDTPAGVREIRRHLSGAA